MPCVKIEGRGWVADVLISPSDSEWTHIEAMVISEAAEEFALAGAQWVMEYFGKGRTCTIRVAPEADTCFDFDTQKTVHKGYVRFSWENAAYPWYNIKPAISIPIAAA